MNNPSEVFPESEIILTRGDTCNLTFQRLDANGDPILTKATKAFFTVKKNTRAFSYLIRKTIDDMTFDEGGNYHFTIEPSDTNRLSYGEYVFDLEIIAGYKQTIAKSKFIVGEEVTFVGNEV